MEIFQIVGVGLVTTIMVIVLKEHKPEIAVQLSLLFGVLIFLLMINKIIVVASILKELALKANIKTSYISTLFKIVGIAYVSEFGAQICRDSGEGLIADKIEFAAKILIMVIALPIMFAVMQLVIDILP